MKIYKYPLEITDRQVIPTGYLAAYPLSVAEQNGQLALWAYMDDKSIPQLRDKNNTYELVVEIVGTGQNFDETMRYVGTVVMSNGFVWHVFAESRVKK